MENQNRMEGVLATGDKVTAKNIMEAKISVKSGDFFGIQNVVKDSGHLPVVYARQNVLTEWKTSESHVPKNLTDVVLAASLFAQSHMNRVGFYAMTSVKVVKELAQYAGDSVQLAQNNVESFAYSKVKDAYLKLRKRQWILWRL